MRRPFRLVAAIVAVSALTASACGGGEAKVANSSATTVTTAGNTTSTSAIDTTTTAAANSTTSSSLATPATTSSTARATSVTVAATPRTTSTTSGISRATPIFPTATTSTTADSGSPNLPPPPATGTVTVFAAASLTAAYTDLGKAFQAANPDAQVKLNFAASSTLVTQINQGAPADVFASADDANMKKLTDAGNNLGSPIEFATNKLQVIVGKGNPKGITSVTDLAKSGIVSVTCDPAVPIGAYTQQVFQKAGITVKPKSLEPDVKGIVTKVTAGEADAGVVYATDVLAAGSAAAGVAIPDNLNVIANYPLSVVRSTHDSYSSQAFMNYVLSAPGQAILAKYGFTGP